MKLFLISNSIISLMVYFYNRYSKISNSSKLILSTFSLACWLIPFTLIRDLFPKSTAITIQWILPLTDYVDSSSLVQQPVSFFDIITLTNTFIVLCMIGFVLFMVKLQQHKKWLNQLKQLPSDHADFHYKNIPVFISEQIKNALLSGYKKPKIWINPKLINTPYQDIILQHEFTHIKNKDNYWFFFNQFIKSIYWWNPIVRVLCHNFAEQIESRCDLKTSQSFNEGIYQQKLTELILSNSLLTNLNQPMPVAHTGFVSAVISKNSNIRRLKSLKEKQTMNTFSKILLSFIMLSTISLLTLPISSVDVLANSEKQTKNKGISLNFEAIPVEAVGKILAEVLDLQAVVADEIKSEKVTIQLFSEPEETVLQTLTQQLNINFVQQGSQLIVSALEGGVNQLTFVESVSEQTLLKINFQQDNNKMVNNDLLVTNDQWMGFQSNGFRFNIFATKIDDNRIFLTFKVFELINNEYQLISNSKLMTAFNSTATVEVGEEVNNQFQGFTLTVTPEII